MENQATNAGGMQPTPGVPEAISQRKTTDASFFYGNVATGATDTSLADLIGLLPDDELRAAQAESVWLRLLQLPQLSFIKASCDTNNKPPFHMYV